MAADVDARDSEALSRKIALLNQKLDESVAANNSAKSASRLITILIAIAAVGGVILAIVWPVKSAYDNKDTYRAAMTEMVDSRIQPAFKQELDYVLKETAPKLLTLVRTRFEARQNDIAGTMDREVNLFLENMKKTASDEWAKRGLEIGKKMEARMIKEFPELSLDNKGEVIMGNAQVATENAVRRVIVENLGEHLTHVSEIETTLRLFPVPDHIKQMDSEKLSTYMTETLFHFATNSMKSSLSPAMKDYLGQLSEKK